MNIKAKHAEKKSWADKHRAPGRWRTAPSSQPGVSLEQQEKQRESRAQGHFKREWLRRFRIAESYYINPQTQNNSKLG